ncbi:hypothetical protein QFZ63_001264 [Streptomyces sp. B3I7]|uniref:hypothetical protein n=1 Tax=unclassified Streptomyces TaxID=2593676 RepID=UPI002785C9F3|nr:MULTISPECIES: hypothetical protein [unclassified Streptomyces]MDQ0790710.1 hypothetical protein [Streptomyces sp. B3I8]MDQ0809550.1 hypothetical protein [Streptomyces sp. B3I7]
MRAIRVASAALLGLSALTLTAPAAVAYGGGEGEGEGGHGNGESTRLSLSVMPEEVSPGGHVTLTVRGCEETARVSSGVFDTVTVPKGQSSASTTVDWDARPGATYTVTVRCGHETEQAELTISERAQGGGGHTDPHGMPPGALEHGVRAGIGGSIGGFDLKEIGLGTALVTGSVGVAWYRARRRAAAGTAA